MEHLLVNRYADSELNTKKICDLHQVMKKHNQFSEETSFRGSHKGKFSDFHLLEDMRKKRQQRL